MSTWLRLRGGMVFIGGNAATKHRGCDHGVCHCSCPNWPHLDNFVTHFSFPITCLAHKVADYIKCASYCLIILLLQTTLHWLTISYSRTDFYGVKVTFSLQWNVLQRKIFYTKIMLWFRRNFNLLNASLLWCLLEKKKTCTCACAHKDIGLYVEDSELTMNDMWTTVNRHHNISYNYKMLTSFT